VLTIGRTRISRQSDPMFIFVHCTNLHPEIGPREQSNQFHIPVLGPGFLDITALELELDRPALRAGTLDPEKAIVWRPGPLLPLAVDEELPEIPTPFSHFRNFRSPKVGSAFDSPPASDLSPPAQNRCLVAKGHNHQRPLSVGSGIFRADSDRFGKLVKAAVE